MTQKEGASGAALRPQAYPVNLSIQRMLTTEVMVRMLTRHLGSESEAKKLALRVAQAAQIDASIAGCTPLSIASAVLTVAAERLEFGKEVYLIPRSQRVRGSDPPVYVKVLSAQTSYHGELARVRRATGGKVVPRAAIILAGDTFEFEPSALNPIRHVSNKLDAPGDESWRGAWAYMLEDGSRIHNPVVMTRAEIEAHRDQYVQKDRNGNIPRDSIWTRSPGAAWLKTVVRRAGAMVGRGGLLHDLDEIQRPIEQDLNAEISTTPAPMYGVEGALEAIALAERVQLDEVSGAEEERKRS